MASLVEGFEALGFVSNLPATVVYVLYRTPSIDLSWIPENDETEVVFVHNDATDTAVVGGHTVLQVRYTTNLGFGAGVNRAAALASGQRLILVNPDAQLERQHLIALAGGDADEVVAVPLVGPDGHATSVVNRYPTPASLVLTAWRVGRIPFLSRGTRPRRVLSALLGAWGREHEALRSTHAGSWPLHSHWASGAAISVDRSRFGLVGGFDEGYFLYLEDVDLCERLSARFPGMHVRLASVDAGFHGVSQSSALDDARRGVDRAYVVSARRYAAGRAGVGWAICRVGLTVRAAIAGRW